MRVKDLGHSFKVWEGNTVWIILKSAWKVKTKKQALELVEKLESEKEDAER